MKLLLPNVLIACCAAVVGCQEPVDLGELSSAQIIVESRLRAGDGVFVEMRVLDHFGSPGDATQLEGTTGTIEGDDGSVAALEMSYSSQQEIHLVGTELTVAEGVTYTLSVQSPGFAPITSLTTVPQQVTISPGVASGIAPPSDLPQAATTGVELQFDDLRRERNYYHLVFRLFDSDTGEGLGLVDDAQVRLVRKGVDTPSNRGGWLFDDAGFADSTFFGYVEFDDSLFEGVPHAEAVLELRTVSRAYFDYAVWVQSGKVSGTQQTSKTGLADNVLGGRGLFGSYSSSLITRQLR